MPIRHGPSTPWRALQHQASGLGLRHGAIPAARHRWPDLSGWQRTEKQLFGDGFIMIFSHQLYRFNYYDLYIHIYIYVFLFIFILSWFNDVFLLNGTFQQLRRPIFVHRGLTGLRVLWVWCPATISCRFTYQEMLELTGRNWKYLYLGDLAICWVTFGGSLHRIIRIQPAVSPLLWHGAAIKHGFPENPPNDFAAKPPLSSGSFQPRFGYRYLVSDIPSGKLT